MSPSPDHKSQPTAQPINVRKSSAAAASNQLTAQNSLEKPVLMQTNDSRERKKEPAAETINIQNVK